MAKRILIVDDEIDICEILRFNLQMEGYEVLVAEGPIDIRENLPDLILLDVMMTPMSGFEWAEKLKADPITTDIPIIFCTAKTTEADTLAGFALGSDDYIYKPFRISEVKARVKAVLHRFDVSQNAKNTLKYEGIILNLDSKKCIIDGEEITLSKLEFELLALLLSKPGQVFSRERIISTVWPEKTIVLDRTVDVNITRIRKKIGKYGQCIRTRFGYGYIFEK